MNNRMFAYCHPDGEVLPWSGQLAHECVECSLCGATFPSTSLHDGTLDLDADKCPKCPQIESMTR